MIKVLTHTIDGWQTAIKTKPVRAICVNQLIAPSIAKHLHVKTREGMEPLDINAILCEGVVGEPWQQTKQKFFKAYDVQEIDHEGWMIGVPKPSREVNVFQVFEKEFYIIGQWGTPSEDGPRQYGASGDWIGQNPDDPSDVWIIQKAIFDMTYEIV